MAIRVGGGWSVAGTAPLAFEVLRVQRSESRVAGMNVKGGWGYLGPRVLIEEGLLTRRHEDRRRVSLRPIRADERALSRRRGHDHVLSGSGIGVRRTNPRQ